MIGTGVALEILAECNVSSRGSLFNNYVLCGSEQFAMYSKHSAALESDSEISSELLHLLGVAEGLHFRQRCPEGTCANRLGAVSKGRNSTLAP